MQNPLSIFELPFRKLSLRHQSIVLMIWDVLFADGLIDPEKTPRPGELPAKKPTNVMETIPGTFEFAMANDYCPMMA